MKRWMFDRRVMSVLLVCGTCLQLGTCGLTQRQLSGIAETALTTALTSALQAITTGLLSGGAA